MRFTKMQGIGNDYVYLDCFAQSTPADPPRLARSMSDRHFGIGSDGLILIEPSDVADLRMRMFNADGSESEMCGNGIRCVARYAYDHAVFPHAQMRIETGNGVLGIQLNLVDGEVATVRVDMGQPILEPARVPTTLAGNPVIEQPLDVDGRQFQFTAVSMGNPHAIAFVDEITDELVLGVGPRVERHEAFPNRTNVEFVRVLSSDEVDFRVWERGTGETLACGTGACAVCVAGVLAGRTNRRIVAHLLGGDLELEWADDDHVYMTGPAVEVFSGDWPEPSPVAESASTSRSAG